MKGDSRRLRAAALDYRAGANELWELEQAAREFATDEGGYWRALAEDLLAEKKAAPRAPPAPKPPRRSSHGCGPGCRCAQLEAACRALLAENERLVAGRAAQEAYTSRTSRRMGTRYGDIYCVRCRGLVGDEEKNRYRCKREACVRAGQREDAAESRLRLAGLALVGAPAKRRRSRASEHAMPLQALEGSP